MHITPEIKTDRGNTSSFDKHTHTHTHILQIDRQTDEAQSSFWLQAIVETRYQALPQFKLVDTLTGK